MKCSVHTEKDVVGYCTDCGAFGCDECLVVIAKGDNLCGNCQKARARGRKAAKHGIVSKFLGEKKTPPPGSERPVFSRSSVAAKARTGRKLVVHYKDKTIIKGTTYKLDLQTLGFYLVPLELVDGKDRVQVNFSDLKAIHFVRDFEGNTDSAEFEQEFPLEGQDVRVAFRDGEIVEGHTMHRFDPACRHFFMIPKDGNSISILVERSALKGIDMEGFREGIFSEEEGALEVSEDDKKKAGRAPLSQNESMGDLYFSMKNYDSALTEYEKVREEYPNDKRLKLKISVCNFNRGVNFVKSRKYREAKTEFGKIDKDDPIYAKAKKKIRKIDKILKDVESIGG